MPKDQKTMYELLWQCWTVAYEKAILKEEFGLAKEMIDKAACEAVHDLTKRLLKNELITPEDVVDKSKNTMEDSIWHHVNNLKKGDMFIHDKLTIDPTSYGENVLNITVENCTYQESCKWALNEPEFRKNGKYRCQRLGCFVGAVKKYMREDNLSEDKRDKVSYFMETVMDEIEDEQKPESKCRCKGFIFLDEELMLKNLLKNNPTKLPPQLT